MVLVCCLHDVSDIYRRRRVKTSHYALATGFMALGMMLPGMVMDLFKKIGYGNFFIWVFIATIPGLILSRFLIFQKTLERNQK
jgi:PAT family beta-lactamase induction signal transducer AmpG